jgi:hypothetical protein
MGGVRCCGELSEVAHYRGWPTSLGVNLIPQSFKIRHIDLVPLSRANASKNRHFRVVVASLPANGSGDGVWKRAPQRVGAIIR